MLIGISFSYIFSPIYSFCCLVGLHGSQKMSVHMPAFFFFRNLQGQKTKDLRCVQEGKAAVGLLFMKKIQTEVLK